jgi:hypothetical protein
LCPTNSDDDDVADEARHEIGIRERLVLQDSLSADR